MPIDIDAALAAEAEIEEISWTSTDVLLYHLSLGAGSRTSRPELDLTYEQELTVLPTFGLVAGKGPTSQRTSPTDGSEHTQAEAEAKSSRMRLPGIDVDLRAVLHAGQSITAHQQLPVEGSARSARSVSAVYDLGKAALIELETNVDGESGPLWTERSQIFVRGAGGFGGEPAPRQRSIPDRAPDARTTIPVRPDQAMLYRLNGDFNPLHIDPDFAAAAGLANPILHGLGTFGIAAKTMLTEIVRVRPERIREIGARFSGMVVPGDLLLLEAWETGPGSWSYRLGVDGGEGWVLDEGAFVLS